MFSRLKIRKEKTITHISPRFGGRKKSTFWTAEEKEDKPLFLFEVNHSKAGERNACFLPLYIATRKFPKCCRGSLSRCRQTHKHFQPFSDASSSSCWIEREGRWIIGNWDSQIMSCLQHIRIYDFIYHFAKLNGFLKLLYTWIYQLVLSVWLIRNPLDVRD